MFTLLLASVAFGQHPTAGNISSLAISNNCIALCDYDGRVRIRMKRNTKGEKSIAVPGGVRYLQWTGDGSRLVLAGPKQISMVTQDGLATGQTLSLLPWKEISALDVACDGTLVAFGSNEGDLVVWNPATGKRRTHKLGNDIQSVAFSADHRLLACGNRSQLDIIDSSSFNTLASVDLNKGSNNYIYSISFISGHEILCSLSDGTVRICDATKVSRNRILIHGKGQCLSSTAFDHGRKIAAITIRGNNRTGLERDQVISCSVSGKQHQVMDLVQQPACLAAFPNDDFFYIAFRNGIIKKVQANRQGVIKLPITASSDVLVRDLTYSVRL